MEAAVTDTPPPEELLLRARPHEPRTFPQVERRVELASCTLFVVAAAALLALAPPATPDPWALAALLLGYAFAARIRIWCGGGSTVPTQLVLVPALFALPPSLVPPLVALALVAGLALDALRGREAPIRMAYAVGDAWHSLAPAIVFAAAGAPAAELDAAPVLAIALAAQFTADTVASLLRERYGRVIQPRELLPVLLTVCAGDLALAPVAFAAVVATDGSAASLLLLAPVVALLSALTRDRNARLVEATERVDQLRRERGRVAEASRRLGRAFGATFSREALVDLVEASAADALDCAPGDAVLELGSAEESHRPSRLELKRAADHEAARAADDLLHRALAEAPPGGGCAALREGDRHALAHVVLSPSGIPRGTLGVVRSGRRFGSAERELLAILASQAAAGLENVSLHELVRRQATTDELTGLANLRAFRARLASEVERARRHDLDLSLVLIDLDHFKRVNDAYGHLEGDRVLGAIADALSTAARADDLAARYGGEELVLLMPGSDSDGATAAAERLRTTVESLRVSVGDGDHIAMTASFGVATSCGRATNAHDLLAAADAALYAAKRAGRNCVHAAPASALMPLLHE
jgi:diguanylate cyclase (GGDEF)-like protein